MKRLSRCKKGQRGFTLIELLVVIAILGVLGAVTVPNVLRFIGKGKLEAANTEAKTVQLASDAYYTDYGKAALDVSALMADNLLREPPKGSYTIDSSGLVTGTSHPDGFTWDSVNHCWK